MIARFRRLSKSRRREFLILAFLIVMSAGFRIFVAHHWPNDAPDDGRVYAQIARNLLEQHKFSDEAQPPYEPTLIRLPGYPLFVAAIYKVFGHGNNGAVRIVQALVDTGTCALIALLAFYWQPDKERNRTAAIAALALAAVCPFTTIYSATILTEVPTMFLAMATCFAATLAFRNMFTTEDTEEDQGRRLRRALLWWIVAGLLGGLNVLFRPDSGLFVAAIGFTLLIDAFRVPTLVELFSRKKGPTKVGTLHADEGGRHLFALPALSRTIAAAFLFSLVFALVLTPWTIRNWRAFHLFQPLAPAHGEMPGELVPRGYHLWLRTWLDDERYIGTFLWSLDNQQIALDDVPPYAFDSAEEKDRVAALLNQYNHPQGSEIASNPKVQPSLTPPASPTPAPSLSKAPAASPQPSPKNSAPSANANNNAEEKDDESDQGDEGDNSDQSDQSQENGPAQMTAEIDRGFAQLAHERIARHPFRFYVWLPIARAHTMWFDTHSQYWPFEGDLLPFDELDYAAHQQYWLSLFAGLTAAYTLLGLFGGWLLWASRKVAARRWLLLTTLIIGLRLAFFSTLENPEPRYVVEFFPFLSVLGGIAIAQIGAALKKPRLGPDKHA
jgi:Dolichyl-phosphate-mannose-protein mannosyltransferase